MKFLVIFLVVITALVLIFYIIDIPFIGVEHEVSRVWSIGVYKFYKDGTGFRCSPFLNVNNPVFTAKDVTDRDAEYVADPFLIHKDGLYYMFFEVMAQGHGNIGLAISKDGINWKYERIVLDEPFHLSYPCVFKSGEDYYMIPESGKDESARLYKAEAFPYKWCFVKKLVEGEKFADPTILRYQNRWWLFVSTDRHSILRLYHADNLEGPWIEHPKSPVVRENSNIARPAGNLIYFKDRLIRVAQDDYPDYGNSVRAFEITKLDTADYQERELRESPILKASGRGWNKDGMHHISTCQINDKESIALVDGQIDKRPCRFYIELPEFLGKFFE